MLLVKYTNLNFTKFVKKYENNVVELSVPDKSKADWLVLLMANVKMSLTKYDIVIVDYFEELFKSLNTLKLSYVLVYPRNISSEEYYNNKVECDAFKNVVNGDDVIAVDTYTELEQNLSDKFDWIEIKSDNTNELQPLSENKELHTKKTSDLSMEELLKDDVIITEADIRELKVMSNKFKVAMMLQAKSRLTTVLNLCNVLDKLYAELVKRIDTSITTTDTASLMYTADYISKALSETNQFIMSLITNEKIQNFFIIDNSNVININDDRIDVDKREKLRKATEIVIENIDYFTQGRYEDMVNPNDVVEGESIDANIQT